MDYSELINYLLLALPALGFLMYLRRKQKKPNTTATVSEAFDLAKSDEVKKRAIDRAFSDQDPVAVAKMFDEFGFSFGPDGSFATSPGQDAIRKLVTAIFGAEQSDAVLAELLKYGNRSGEPESARVHLCIIEESTGDITQIQKLIISAKSDFRDVISQAESPVLKDRVMSAKGQDMSTLLNSSSSEHQEATYSDLRQFGLWLLKHQS